MVAPTDETLAGAEIRGEVEAIVRTQAVSDLHTHCFAPSFGHSGQPGGGMMLWGIDELLSYHYLIAEVCRVLGEDGPTPSAIWEMSPSERAGLIWRELFVERAPLSEACRGVITVLARLGLDPNERDLGPIRSWFAAQDGGSHVDRVMDLAGIDLITMTNSPFDPRERAMWLEDAGALRDPRFAAALRIDPVVRRWPEACAALAGWGYGVEPSLGGDTIAEIRRFLAEWLDRTGALYAACSLPPTFRYPDESDPVAMRVIREAVIPELRDRGLPWALMIGSRLRVNPELRQAGDMVGRAEIDALVSLCRDNPGNRFLVTMLSRENQYELAVAARKFPNLLPFGCWWFLNTPSLVHEITEMRTELLGASFVPQHSDARVLEQLVYKWDHSRGIIAGVLADQYERLASTGYRVSKAQIARDVRVMLRDNYRSFVGLPL